MNLASIVEQHRDNNTTADDEQSYGIVVKCYTNVGSISAWGKISIDAREIISIDARTLRHVALVTVETGGDYPQTGIAAIDYDDVEKLCAAIEKIKSIDPKSTKFGFIEAEISQDDLKVVVFNDNRGKMHCSIGADGHSVHMELARLSEVIHLLKKAKSTIEACRSAAA